MKLTVRCQGIEIVYEQETSVTDYPLITMQETKATVIAAITDMVSQAIRMKENNQIKLIES